MSNQPEDPENNRLVLALLVTLLILVAALVGREARAAELSTGAPNESQKRVLRIAADEGAKVEALGETFPLSMQLIALQETWAGAYGRTPGGVIIGHADHYGVGRGSYGVWQVRLETARDVVSNNPDVFDSGMTNDELLALLMTDEVFCARVATHYFAWLYELSGGDWRRALLAYNRGPGRVGDGRDPRRYIAGILAKKQWLERYWDEVHGTHGKEQK